MPQEVGCTVDDAEAWDEQVAVVLVDAVRVGAGFGRLVGLHFTNDLVKGLLRDFLVAPGRLRVVELLRYCGDRGFLGEELLEEPGALLVVRRSFTENGTCDWVSFPKCGDPAPAAVGRCSQRHAARGPDGVVIQPLQPLFPVLGFGVADLEGVCVTGNAESLVHRVVWFCPLPVSSSG